MALKSIPGFCEASYESRARGVSVCRSVNLRLERNRATVSKTPFTLFPRAGKRLFATLPVGPIKGAWSNKTRVFVVAGIPNGGLYELSVAGILPTPTGPRSSCRFMGNVAVGGNPATMRANGIQLLICSAGNVYVATGTTLFQPIINFANGLVSVDADGITVHWIDGDKFTIGDPASDIVPGNAFMVDTVLGEVATVPSDILLTLTAPLPAAPLAEADYYAGEGTAGHPTCLLTGAMCECIDQYGIVNTPNSKQFRFSAPGNFKRWDELDKGIKSGSTDNIAAVHELYGQLALVGDTNSTEIWGEAPTVDQVFARISGRTMSIGTDAPWSVAELLDGSLCWLLCADQGKEQIVRTTGSEPERISDHALENAMRSYSKIDDAIGATYLDNAHSIYRITFPTANRAWEFDATTTAETGHPCWNECGIVDPTFADEEYAADPAYYHVNVTWPNGLRMHLGFDFASGKVWEISPDFLDDDGVDFPVMRVSPHVSDNLDRTACPEFALDCELGRIDPSEVGLDGKPLIPKVSMSYSDDGGNLWIDQGDASLGRTGEYQGTELSHDELFDATAQSQTNPQTFMPTPHWYGLADFYIARAWKIKSIGRHLRALYDGLAEFTK